MTQDSAQPMAQDSQAALGLAHGQVCYLQLPAASSQRAAEFYQAVFGWQTGTHYPDFEVPSPAGQRLIGLAGHGSRPQDQPDH